MSFLRKLFVVIFIFLFVIQITYPIKKKVDNIYLLEIVDNTTLQKVYDVNKSKDEIYNTIMDWIPNTFNDDKSKIIKSDKDNYLIEGLGNLVLTFSIMNIDDTKNIFFNYKFEIKDSKLRLSILRPYYEMINAKTGLSNTYYFSKDSFGYTLKDINDSIAKMNLIKSLIDKINGENIKSDNW